jgi:hypothetical protein
MPKKLHPFPGKPTTDEFRRAVAGDFLDFPAIPKGTRIYARKNGVGCWHPQEIRVEDSGVYIELGADSNPQNADDPEQPNFV